MAPCLLLRLHGDPMITGSLAPWIFGWIVLYKNTCGVGVRELENAPICSEQPL